MSSIVPDIELEGLNADAIKLVSPFDPEFDIAARRLFAIEKYLNARLVISRRKKADMMVNRC